MAVIRIDSKIHTSHYEELTDDDNHTIDDEGHEDRSWKIYVKKHVVPFHSGLKIYAKRVATSEAKEVTTSRNYIEITHPYKLFFSGKHAKSNIGLIYSMAKGSNRSAIRTRHRDIILTADRD